MVSNCAFKTRLRTGGRISFAAIRPTAARSTPGLRTTAWPARRSPGALAEPPATPGSPPGCRDSHALPALGPPTRPLPADGIVADATSPVARAATPRRAQPQRLPGAGDLAAPPSDPPRPPDPPPVLSGSLPEPLSPRLRRSGPKAGRIDFLPRADSHRGKTPQGGGRAASHSCSQFRRPEAGSRRSARSGRRRSVAPRSNPNSRADTDHRSPRSGWSLSARGRRHRSHGTATLVRWEGLQVFTPSPPNIPCDPCLVAPAQGGPAVRPPPSAYGHTHPCEAPRRSFITPDPPSVAPAHNHLNPLNKPRRKHYFFPVLNWGGMMQT